mmetsp:Transcript_8721/g.13487  ORF Transcript_8721/g.13487 Transcript_8721/m.13487 type:complete len:199 (+) Transcript_8721:1-597(+)
MQRTCLLTKLTLLLLVSQDACGFVLGGRTNRRTSFLLNMAETTTSTVKVNPIIDIAAKGMGLLAPIFKAEAALQAKVLASDEVVADAKKTIANDKKKNKLLIYTYGLSPFSVEAISVLESSGYQYEKIELGLEWFLLGGKESAMRVALAEDVDNGATSLPKIFVGGQCIGGCTELNGLVSGGEFEQLMKKARVPKRKA